MAKIRYLPSSDDKYPRIFADAYLKDTGQALDAKLIGVCVLCGAVEDLRVYACSHKYVGVVEDGVTTMFGISWITVVFACRKHGPEDVADWVFGHLPVNRRDVPFSGPEGD